MNEHLPSADPDRTAVREPSAEPGTTDATADATDPRLAGWMDELRGMMADSLPDVPGYRITAEIAKGGMGKVYAAHHLALDREVAIKTLLPGANAERFVTESKITAKLPHPNIPPVYELGTLPDGTPFLAMKLVRGETLSALLKARPNPSHDLPRWVQVFEQIAQAVGFAHSKGVIHRDLKPLNVMVGEFGEVQVMDWGLARTLASDRASGGREVADSTPPNQGADAPRSPDADLTSAGAVLGTPGYMAPEQARGEPLDARADVFALGATLAVVLTGKAAFVGSTVKETIDKAAAADLADVFARLDACGADADLIAVAKRCLSADRDSRPADGRVVADEVAAYRAGVEARLKEAETDRAKAETRATETRKRQRAMAVAGGIIAGVLITGLGVTLGLLDQTRKAEGQAKANEQTAISERDAKDVALKQEEQAKQLAEREKTIAFTVRDVMKNKLLRQANPYEHGRWAFDGKRPAADAPGPQQDLTVRAVLDRAAQELGPDRIEQAFPGQPQVQAEVLETIGETYEGIKEYGQAVRFVEAAQAIREKHLGVDHPTALAGRTNLAFAYLAASRLRDAARVMTALGEALERQLAELPDNPEDRARHPALEGIDAILGRVAERANPYSFVYPQFELNGADSALLALQFSVLVKRVERLGGEFARRFGANDRRTLVVESWRAFALHGMGQTRQASELFEVLLKRAERHLPVDDPAVEGLREILMSTYADLGNKSADRLRLLEAAYQSRLRTVGPYHPNTLTILSNLAEGYQDTGEPDKALGLFEEAIKLQTAKLGPDHPDTLHSRNSLAITYHYTGKLNQAIRLFEESLKLSNAKLGPDHQDTLTTLNNLALAYRDAGNLDKALPLFEKCFKQRKAKLGPDHHNTLISMNSLAMGYRDTGALEKALPLFEEALKLFAAKFGRDHTNTLNCMNNLALGYQSDDKPEQALPLFEECFKRMKANFGRDHPDTLTCMGNLADCYRAAGKLDLALPLLEEALKLRSAKLGRDHPHTLNSMNNLALGYRDAGKRDLALPLFVEALKLQTAKVGRDHPHALTTMNNLADCYRVAGKLDLALPLYEECYKLRATKVGRDHPDTLTTMNYLALSYRAVGQKDKALPLFEECYKLRTAKLGRDHSHTLMSLNNLAVSYRDAGQLEKALALLEEALDVRTAKLGRDHPHTLLSLNNLAVSYQDAGQLGKALPLHEECLKLRKAKLGPDHPDTLDTMNSLGVAYCAAKQGDKAAPLLKEYIAVQRKRLPKEHTQFAGLLAQGALKLLQCDQFVVAEEMLRECLTIREKKEPDAWTTFNTQSTLGWALLGQKKYADAEPLLLKGHEGMMEREKSIPKAGETRIPEALDRLIALYTATDKPDEVKKYTALRAKYPAAKKEVLPPPRAEK